MRIKFILTSLFITILTTFISCKKSDPTQNGNSSSKVKTYIEDYSSQLIHVTDTFNISYDANDRVISLISTFSGGKFIYNYSGSSSYTLDIMRNSHLIIRETSFINANLLVDSTFQYNDTKDSGTTKLIYNSSGLQTQNRTYDYSISTGSVLWKINNYTYDPNGNLIKDIDTNPSGNINLITTYTYTNVATTVFSLATIYKPLPYKYLPNTITYFYPSTNTTETDNFSYTFDSFNRVSSQIQLDHNGNSTVKKFLYF
jgi:hypothetical protein